MGAQGLDAFGTSIKSAADTSNASMTEAQTAATAANATPGDMIAVSYTHLTLPTKA